MFGLMQDWPMRVSRILDHAAKYHAGREIISCSIEGPITRSNWAEVRTRAIKLSQEAEAKPPVAKARRQILEALATM